MPDINSTTPLGTEAAGTATNGDGVLTVLSFNAAPGDGFYCSIPTATGGYWKTSAMAEWRPIPANGLNLSGLRCETFGAWALYVKRIPSGSNLSDIRAGRILV